MKWRCASWYRCGEVGCHLHDRSFISVTHGLFHSFAHAVRGEMGWFNCLINMGRIQDNLGQIHSSLSLWVFPESHPMLFSPMQPLASMCYFFFFWRKISPELTAANPPLFAEEDWPWPNIHAHLPLFYMWDTYHSMACQVVPCLHQGSEPANPGLSKRNVHT